MWAILMMWTVQTEVVGWLDHWGCNSLNSAQETCFQGSEAGSVTLPTLPPWTTYLPKCASSFITWRIGWYIPLEQGLTYYKLQIMADIITIPISKNIFVIIFLESHWYLLCWIVLNGVKFILFPSLFCSSPFTNVPYP